jgi:pre-mRNA-splicing factor 38A
MSGANSTAPEAHSVHGTNPQHLVERITRDKIYAMTYWKEKCFGVSAAALVDLAMDIREFGGVFGGTQRCTNFICLLLKMLQIQPDKEIIVRDGPSGARSGGHAVATRAKAAACLVSRLTRLARAQVEFIKNEEHKYVRLLGAFYLRLVGKPLEVYQYLEVRWFCLCALSTPPDAHAHLSLSRCTTTTVACVGARRTGGSRWST